MDFELSKPLRTHKGDIPTLTLKEPTARSFVNFGNPFTVRMTGDNAEFVFDDKATMGFLADATGHDQITLEAISGGDYWRLRQALANVMFAGVGGKNPTEQSGT